VLGYGRTDFVPDGIEEHGSIEENYPN